MKFMRDGYYLFFLFMALGGAAYALGSRAGFVFFLLGAFCLWFFRDPDRKIILDGNAVLSACDGTVTDVLEAVEGEFLKTNTVQIVSFLSPFNVHINRAPVEGIVKKQAKSDGSFAPAFLKSSGKNARNSILIRGKKADVLVVQIVGIVARRIVSWVREGDSLQQGQKIGMIRFGSRTDVHVPKSRVLEVLVKKGDKVFAGKTVLLRLKD